MATPASNCKSCRCCNDNNFIQHTHGKDLACTVVNLGAVTRLLLAVTPQPKGTVRAQVRNALDIMASALKKQRSPQTVTFQTVFLKKSDDRAVCETLFEEHFGTEAPVTTYILQPPCNGAAVAIEAWSIGGEGVRIERHQANVLSVNHDDLRWTYCGDLGTDDAEGCVYDRSVVAFQDMKAMLAKAGVRFDRVMRTWLYLGTITGPEGDLERYMELNRARTDLFRNVRFCRGLLPPEVRHGVYPASTGIGMKELGVAMSAMALETKRKDVFLLPLENPQQTPVYQYERVYSPKSPKFVRAMAAGIGDYVMVWVSGTASIINSKTVHVGDARKQTEQTIENIEKLIAPENFARNGVKGAGAALSDMARVRVYVKYPKDYKVIREVCEKRFGKVPVIYTVADVCRSDLLVEMEGVAFARRTSAS